MHTGYNRLLLNFKLHIIHIKQYRHLVTITIHEPTHFYFQKSF